MVAGRKQLATNHAQRIGVSHTCDGRCCIITFLNVMTDTKKEAGTLLPMTVMEGITVQLVPDGNHGFLMPTKDVAIGYGVSEYSIRQHKLAHASELLEGKHFISGVSIPHAASKGSSKGTFWTKRGVGRLGVFITTYRARLFRDWAEELVIHRIDRQLTLFDAPAKALPGRKGHNRLTNDRLLDIMADVCRIENNDLRISIAAKLMKGGAI